MRSIFRYVLYTIVIACAVAIVTGTTYFFSMYHSIKDIEIKLETPIANNEVYDAQGNLIVRGNYLHQYAKLEDVSPYVINAIIATEDQTFYSNNGINPYRIVKATLDNLQSKRIISGASTITQQYVKNTFLSNEKTYDRKLREVLLSLQLTKKYSKNQILEAYLNSLLFGGSIYGIEMASTYYFGHSSKELTISEAAMLAGMIQLPNAYNPYLYPENANKRKNMVLSYMLDNSYITPQTYSIECNVDIATLLRKKETTKTVDKNASYLDYLNYYLKTNNIYSDKQYTYLDQELQADIFDIVQNKYHHFDNEKIKCAIVAIDNSNAAVKALVGNRDTNALVFNYALTKMQPGSTIKPLIDYAPAFELLGYQPSSIIKDEEYTYSDGTPIHNWDRLYKGDITLRYALKDSRNIPALKLYQELDGRQEEFINRLGLYPSELYEADCIGGATKGYSLLELTTAYTAFANLGKFQSSTPISSYETNNLRYEISRQRKQVMKESTAFFINSILHDVFKGGKYDLSDSYLMAKTGQTNYDEKTRKLHSIPEAATKDSWLIAYTKSLTVGIWVGFDEISSDTYLIGSQKQIAKKIMYTILQKYAKKNEYYDVPQSIVPLKVINDFGQIYLSSGESDSYVEYFLVDNQPLTKKKYNTHLAI